MNDHIAVRIKYFKKHATHFFHAKILALCAIVCQSVSLGNFMYDIYSQKTFIPTCVCIISISGIIVFNSAYASAPVQCPQIIFRGDTDFNSDASFSNFSLES